MPAKDPRNTRAYKKLARQVRHEEPICKLNLPGCTRWSTTADHIVPVKHRPDLALVRSNLQGACVHCNCKKRDQRLSGTVNDAPALTWFD